MSLLNILKSGRVVVADNVYTIVNKEPDYTYQDQYGAAISLADSPDLIDDDAMHQRLKLQLEEERDAIIKAANDEAGFIRNQAYHEGYANGIAEKAGELEKLAGQTKSVLQEMNDSLQKRLAEFEENLTVIAVDITSKILARKIDSDDMILTDLIRKTAEETKNAEWIKITLSDKLSGVLKEIEKELRDGVSSGKLDVVAKEAPNGTCIVETQDGIIDASVYTQLENLKKYFAK
jgi:flagellar biosynthesis/type III secretory pathway protein FliH